MARVIKKVVERIEKIDSFYELYLLDNEDELYRFLFVTERTPSPRELERIVDEADRTAGDSLICIPSVISKWELNLSRIEYSKEYEKFEKINPGQLPL